MTATALALGWRAALASRPRFALLALVGAIVTGCMIVVVMAPTVRAREDRRQRQLAAEATAIGRGAIEVPAFIGTRQVLLVAVDAQSGVRAPGLDAPLPAGTVRFSPALARAVEDDDDLAGWFPYRRLDDLPAGAVGGAGEYKAYIGVSPEQLRTVTFDAGPPLDDARDGFGYYQWLGFVLFVGAPGIGLLALASRFGRQVRQHRNGTLRLLGMPGRSCRIALGVETGLPVAVGAAVTAAVVTVAIGDGPVVVPVVGRWVFGADAHVGALPLAAIVVTVAAGGAGIGLATARRRTVGRVGDLVARADVSSRWAAVPYALGVAVAVWAFALAAPKDPRRFAAAVLVAAGLPGAVAAGSGLAALALRWRTGPLPWFLAMRKLAAGPRSATRVAGIVSIVMFIVIVAQPISQVIAEPGWSWEAEAQDQSRTTMFGRASTESPIPVRLRGGTPDGTHLALPEVALWATGQGPPAPATGTGLVASCAELEELVGVEVNGCDGTVQALVAEGSAADGPPAAAGPPLDVRRADGQPLAQVAPPATTVTIPAGTAAIDYLPPLLIPPDAIGPDTEPFASEVLLRIDADVDAWNRAQSWIMASSPFYAASHEFGLAPDEETRSWILLGFLFAATVAFMGAVLSALDDRSNVREWTALRAVGLPASGLLSIRLLTAAVASAVAVLAALVPGLLLAHAWLRVNDDDLPSYAPITTAAGIGAGSIVLVTLVSGWFQLRAVGDRPATGR